MKEPSKHYDPYLSGKGESKYRIDPFSERNTKTGNAAS